jgi:hypothetical protein
MTLQASLFGEKRKPKIYLSGLAKSYSFSQDEVLKWIIALHNNGKQFDVDLTYSKGIFWRNFPKPKYCFDILPIHGTIQASAENIPLSSESATSVMFDPPFIIKDVKGREPTGIIEKRFSAFKSIEDLWHFYESAIIESRRILKPGGILVVKCQDTVSGGRQYISHYQVIQSAERIELYCKDIFILLARSALVSPFMKRQEHARKMHSYFIVFVKE